MSETKYASFAPKDVKEISGSSLWDNVNATITGFKFTKELPANYKIEPRAGETVSPIGVDVNFEVEGSAPVEERRVSQFFSAGTKAGLSWNISEDGYKLVPKVEGAEIYASNFSKFVRSMVENGLDVAVIEAGDFSKILGLKGHFKRIEDKDAQERTRTFTKRDGTQGSETSKPKILLCTKVLAQPTGKGASTSAATPAADAASEDFDLDSATADALLTALKAKKGKAVQRSQILVLVSNVVMLGADGKPNPNRAAIAKRAQEEEFLNSMTELGIVKYDAAGKGQPVSLPDAA